MGDGIVGVAVPVVRWPVAGTAPAGEAPAGDGAAGLSAGAVPYFTWANRGAEAMRVWIPR
jgi:hypothetical protein